MQRKYYKNDDLFVPNAGVPMHGYTKSVPAEEIITPQPLDIPCESDKSKKGAHSDTYGAIFKNGKILGRYEADDIILLCIIFLLLQSKDEPDIPLLLALGYIFLSDKDFTLF